MDGGVASPNPFYYTTAGYGVLRNTFSDGTYDFGESDEGLVLASHKEHHFSAYYFLTEKENGRESARALLRAYRKSNAASGIRILRGTLKLL